MDYRADCARCEGLCCVSLPFDRSEAFSFDKTADVPCRHLSRSNRCGVHDTLRERGLSGCAAYDCYGAGQRVTREFLRERSWREDPELAARIFEAFRALKRLHELLALLTHPRLRALGAADDERRTRLLAALEPARGHTLESLAVFDLERAEREVGEFLRSLRHAFRSSCATAQVRLQIAGKI